MTAAPIDKVCSISGTFSLSCEILYASPINKGTVDNHLRVFCSFCGVISRPERRVAAIAKSVNAATSGCITSAKRHARKAE